MIISTFSILLIAGIFSCLSKDKSEVVLSNQRDMIQIVYFLKTQMTEKMIKIGILANIKKSHKSLKKKEMFALPSPLE